MQTCIPAPLDTAVLTGALVCRFALEDRDDDADELRKQLARLFSAAKIGLGAHDTDTPGALAHAHDLGTLCSALIGRLALDGRMALAAQVAVLLPWIDTDDDPGVQPEESR